MGLATNAALKSFSQKLQELIRRGTPKDLAAAQELMKVMSGAVRGFTSPVNTLVPSDTFLVNCTAYSNRRSAQTMRRRRRKSWQRSSSAL
jgi:hypothetical protein